MNTFQAFLVGIAPQHVPALVAALLLPVVVYVARRLRPPALPTTVDEPSSPALVAAGVYRSVPSGPVTSEPPTVHLDEPVLPVVAGSAPVPAPPPVPPRDTVRVWVAWLMGISAAVHLALPLGHFDGFWLTVGFLASGVAYAWLGLRAYEGRSYRLWSALLIVATLVAYMVVDGKAGEEPDQVGIATALDELLALGLCLVPMPNASRRKRFKRFAGSAGTIVITFVVGAVIWASSLAAHGGGHSTDPGSAVADGADQQHAHEHAARAQAGIVMRPGYAEHPTAEQAAAAQALADATRQALTRYARLADAMAAGYQLPAIGEGTAVHMENKKFKNDGKVLDPEHPETLVYAIEGGKATLLGALYVMEQAGVPGPEPGGPITRWHAHNLCVTVTPLGFGIVSPFGSCPALALQITSPEMMHVWVVDNPPGGAFADGLPDAWVSAYNATHGLPAS